MTNFAEDFRPWFPPEPPPLCNRTHDGVGQDGIGYFVRSLAGGEFFADDCKDCRWVEQLRERA